MQATSAKHVGSAFPFPEVILSLHLKGLVQAITILPYVGTFKRTICQHVKTVCDERHMYARSNIMTAITCQHLNALCDARHMFNEPNTLLAITHQHVKAARGALHMYARVNIMLAITTQHAASPPGCRQVLVWSLHSLRL